MVRYRLKDQHFGISVQLNGVRTKNSGHGNKTTQRQLSLTYYTFVVVCCALCFVCLCVMGKCMCGTCMQDQWRVSGVFLCCSLPFCLGRRSSFSKGGSTANCQDLCLLPPPPVLGLMSSAASPGFIHECWGFELRSSNLCSK